MSVSQYRLTWDTYRNNICNGFSSFQQNEEFVDMTLAAEGHLVKVHKNLIALASPYIKEMLQSVSCQHPVVFLNNVSHKILYYILQFIYTGEVQVPADMMDLFMQTSKALHIKGIDNVDPPKIPEPYVPHECATQIEPEICKSVEQDGPTQQQSKDSLPNRRLWSPAGLSAVAGSTPPPPPTCPATRADRAASMISLRYTMSKVNPFPTSDNQNTEVESNCLDEEMQDYPVSAVPHNGINHEIQNMPVIIVNNNNTDSCRISQAVNDPMIDETGVNVNQKSSNIGAQYPAYNEIVKFICTSEDGASSHQQIPKLDVTTCTTTQITHSLSNIITTVDPKSLGIKPQYTISNRGALQLMLNRYMYYCHHQSHNDQKQRWRCMDYRKLHCPALIDMNGETITSRKGDHTHGFHDLKIMKKIKKNIVYTSAKNALEARAQGKASGLDLQ